MASRIQELLHNIEVAIYGEEVRTAIHDAIEECYDDVSTAATAASSATAAAANAANAAAAQTALSQTATTNANNAAAAANAAATAANAAATAAGDAADDISAAIELATTAASNANTKATAANTAATAANSAASSATSAASSANSAATSATSAANNANTKATAANTAATAATTAATAANTAASDAVTAKNAANTAASAANTAAAEANEAADAANEAANSVSEAIDEAYTASSSATNAATSAQTAALNATNATTSANSAASSATAAASSASSAATAANNAAASANTAKTNADVATAAANTATTAATTAKNAANAAAASATSATSAANAAATAANNAASSASTAATTATTAANNADTAATAATSAATAATSNVNSAIATLNEFIADATESVNDAVSSCETAVNNTEASVSAAITQANSAVSEAVTSCANAVANVDDAIGRADDAVDDLNDYKDTLPEYIQSLIEDIGGGTSDHNELTNRDIANQHPMSAITGLQAALLGKISEPAIDGLNGQVLATDGAGHRSWITVSGGGGGSGAVQSVNGKTGVVNLTSTDIGADPEGSAAGVQSNLDNHTENADIHVTTSNKTAWNNKYSKPSTGIPKTDLASAVQTSLSRADTALQEHQSLAGLVTTAALSAVTAKIPTAASSSNQLADKNFVVARITASVPKYISNNGNPFTSVSQLNAYSGSVGQNDYAFVSGTDSNGNAFLDRYKASVSGTTVSWAKEFSLNNVSLSSAQWATLSSGITNALVLSYNAHLADNDIHVSLQEKAGWDGKYTKTSTGIPKTDLDAAVQTSLGKADSALQEHQDISGKISEPAAEGTNGQVLTTDGNGHRSWTTVSGGGMQDTGWVQFTPGSGWSVQLNLYKRRIGNIVYLTGAVRNTSALGQGAYLQLVSDIGADYRPSVSTGMIPLGTDYPGFLLYVDSNGAISVRNRCGESRTNTYISINASYVV